MLKAIDFTKLPLKVRIQQLQNDALTPESILVLSCQGIWPKPIKKRIKSINRILYRIKGGNKIKERVQNNTKKVATGKTPKWFNEMQQMLAEMEYPANDRWGKIAKIGKEITIAHWQHEGNKLTRCKECKLNINKEKLCFFKRAADVLLGVVVDRKKKIYANITKLLEGRIHKEEKN
ncbi:39062_t:CDS:2 [Gigaspora margarita]|uniref:39062_t:CDS:1 n=1 Tax=Gigaspora margarita TaxID=4874 RepID=A0ABN7VRY3_GIGMA|nr:39062_t:CDS:2 [Gigaspora margarita]